MLAKLLSLLKHSSIYSFAAVAGQFIGVILVPIYTRVFSPVQYGIIDLIVSAIALLTLFLIAGLDGGVGRYYVDTDSIEDRRKTASTGILFLAVFSFMVTLVLFPFSGQLSQLLFGSSDYSNLLRVALLTIPFTVLNSSFMNLLRWRLQPLYVAAVSVGTLVLQASLTILLVVFLDSGIVGIFIAAVTAQSLFAIVGFCLARSSYAFTFSGQRLKQMLAFGLPYVILSLSHYVLTYADRYMLRYYVGLEEVGLYAIGYRLSQAISIVLLGFQFAWGPFVLTTYKDDNARQTFAKVFDYVSIILCLAVMFLSLFSKELLHVFTTDEYLTAYRVVPFIATSVAVYCLGAYFAVGIGIAKKTAHVAWIGAVAALANIGLNILLIPPLGMVGAAIATIISFVILAIPLMIVSQKLYRIPYRFSRNFLMYFAAASIIALAYLFLLDHLSWFNLMLKALILLAFLAVPFSLRLVGRPELLYTRTLAVSLVAILRKRARPE